jgi:1,2-phenylacetyl-CoA epoxidase catalytic subunit
MVAAVSNTIEKYTLDGWSPPPDCDFQSWLERAPWRTLQDTNYGVSSRDKPDHPALADDVLVRRIYKLDVATFLTAERVSYQNMSRLVSLAPDEHSQVFLVTQASDEVRHFEVFCKCLSDVGLTPDERNSLMESVTTREMRKFYDLISEQTDKGDFAGAMLAHNVVLEGMAYPVYRYEAAYWSIFAPHLTRIIRGAFADEVHHVRFGESIMRRYLEVGTDSRNRIQGLVKDFHSLMTEVFEAAIHHYIHLYQLVANQYQEVTSQIEIFPNRKMSDVTEEEQVQILLREIQAEHSRRLARIGL